MELLLNKSKDRVFNLVLGYTFQTIYEYVRKIKTIKRFYHKGKNKFLHIQNKYNSSTVDVVRINNN